MKEDNDNLQDKLFMFIRLTSFVVFPMMVGVAAIADPLVRLILTDKWAECIPYMQIICLAYMWDPVMRMSWDLLNVKHRSDYSLKSEIIKKLVAFAILFATIPFGLNVICIGLILYSFADIFIVTRFTRKILPDVTFRKEMKVLFPNFLQSVLMGLVVYIVIQAFDYVWLQLIIGILIGIIVYVILSYIFNRKIVAEIKSFMLSFI